MTLAACGQRGAGAGLALALLMMMGVEGCSDGGGPLSPQAEQGRRVYQAHCTSCHALDPSRPGPVGPPLKGSSRDLLEAKVVRGEYPPGHVPKRATRIMPPLPSLALEVPALAEYLR